ncbi:MAG: transcriptional repressor LexA [Candidatus Krumholzibacteria bacterium]|nr:transcriptional repressor LexA [Candidatus Krumholzibacteria bacterium]
MSPRTPKGQTRERIYRFVRGRLLEGLPPTVREVRDAFNFHAVETAREHLEQLVREGRLAKKKGKARGYGLPTGFKGDPVTIAIPLLGRVQAGELTTAVEDIEGYVPVQSRGTGDLFALTVRGESMTGAGIMPGDIAIVRHQPIANTGDIVVALVGDEATVKRLRIKKNAIELHPENPDFEPIVPDTNELVILGKVIEIRRYIEIPKV